MMHSFTIYRTVPPVGRLAEPHDIRAMTGRLIIEQYGRWWLVMRYINEDRGMEIVSSHPTEQQAEAACRALIFPPQPKELYEPD